MRKGYAGAPPLNKVHRESAKGKLLRVPHGQVSKGAGRPAASSSERDHVSKRAAEASNVALAGAALCNRAVVLPHFTELVTLPVFAGDALRSRMITKTGSCVLLFVRLRFCFVCCVP